MNNKIVYTSWGYDMTMNDYAKVISETDKTIKCVIIGCKVMDDCGRGNGKSVPNPEIVLGKPFRLRKKGDGRYRGSYPYCLPNSDSKRFGYFWDWEGRPNYYNTWD